MSHINSLIAWESLQDKLPKKRYQVYKVICERPGITRHDISMYAGLPINSVTGRVHELIKHGLIKEHGLDCTLTNPRARLIPTDSIDPKPLPKQKKQSKQELIMEYRQVCIENYSMGGEYKPKEEQLRKEILGRMK